MLALTGRPFWNALPHVKWYCKHTIFLVLQGSMSSVRDCNAGQIHLHVIFLGIVTRISKGYNTCVETHADTP